MSSSQNPASRSLRVACGLSLLAAGLLAPFRLAAVTVDELVENPKLNAKKFASYFGNFGYDFGTQIQPAPAFLNRQKGDCDDYAVLADFVLKKHGLDTRLIHIRLTGRVAHAVCYVNENKAYLDYNNRSVFFTLARSGSSLREIADKVAASQEVSWTSASEFSYSYITRRKQMISTVSQTGEAIDNPVPNRVKSSFNVD